MILNSSFKMKKSNFLLPDLDFGFQIHAEGIFDPGLNQFDQLLHIRAAAPLFGGDEIGMFCADRSTADLLTFQSRTVDQGPGAQPTWILKDAAGVFGIQGLGVLLIDPHFLDRIASGSDSVKSMVAFKITGAVTLTQR